jgi:hypothetical protein
MGRHYKGTPDTRGAANWMAKLTDEKVREIRRRVAAGEKHAALGLEMGVHPSRIGKVANRKAWGHVE